MQRVEYFFDFIDGNNLMMNNFGAVALVSVLAISAFAPVSAPAIAAALEPAKLTDTSKGNAWVDGKGMTLYTFEKDAIGKSNCNDKCATAWPPLPVEAGAKASGNWTIVVRADGTEQWALLGKPLYTWMKDENPGEVTGDGVIGFHIAL